MKTGNRKPRRVPRVRMARPRGRPIQLRYLDPERGRECRVSTGTYDVEEAGRQKAELEARLLLGIGGTRRARAPAGPDMPWEEFRDRYRELQLTTLCPRSAGDAESRLDIASRIVRPWRHGDRRRPPHAADTAPGGC